MAPVRMIVVLAVLLLCEIAPAYCGKRVALVIGNGAYNNTPALVNPKNDAQDMAVTLRKLGFTVILGTDLGKDAMEHKIVEFSEALAGAEAAVFFYSGHSLQLGNANFLVPVDAKAKDAAALNFEMERLQAVQELMESKAKVSILFLDACRDNPLARNLTLAAATRSMAEAGTGLASMETGAKGTLIGFSTQPGNVALDGSGRNSPYTGALVEAIATQGEDIETSLKRVRMAVLAATGGRQKPWDHSALVGSFYFNPVPPKTQQGAAQAHAPGDANPAGALSNAPFSAADAASIEQIRNAPADQRGIRSRPRDHVEPPLIKLLMPLFEPGR
jgi:uncharacterized caspase-like protein